MNSEILNKMGLGSLDPFVIILVLLGLILILMLWNLLQSMKIKNIEENYETFFLGTDGTSLKESMQECFDRMGYLIETNQERNRMTENLLKAIGKCYQKTALVKYDALREMGGNLSFALAVLNDENCGFIFNIVNSQEGCFVYAKNVVNGVTEGKLSDEEKKAFERAASISHLKKYENLLQKQKKKDKQHTGVLSENLKNNGTGM
ncbi:MAG: DUF4446 family protein [Lachnospiraceae bacterium]|nr:DUF4446 family protein [Lachnospiraceae bacterium]